MNFNKIVIIIAGCSGAGKSTLANYLKFLQQGAILCSADDYYYEKYNKYKWNPAEIGAAHEYCQKKFVAAIRSEKSLIVVHNTSTRRKDRDYYAGIAKVFKYLVFSLILENVNETKNIHDVPAESLQKQAKNIMESIKLI